MPIAAEDFPFYILKHNWDFLTSLIQQSTVNAVTLLLAAATVEVSVVVPLRIRPALCRLVEIEATRRVSELL